MFNDIAWGENGSTEECIRNSIKDSKYVRSFLAVVGHSWDLDQKEMIQRPVLINQTEIGTELQK